MAEYLHIYAQSFQHQDAWIVGTRDSLMALRDALNRALESQTLEKLESFTGDGEGYSVLVLQVDGVTAAELRYPYVDYEGSFGKAPFEIVGSEAYRKAKQ